LIITFESILQEGEVAVDIAEGFDNDYYPYLQLENVPDAMSFQAKLAKIQRRNFNETVGN